MRKPDVVVTKTALRRGEITKHPDADSFPKIPAAEGTPEDMLLGNELINHKEHREDKERPKGY